MIFYFYQQIWNSCAKFIAQTHISSLWRASLRLNENCGFNSVLLIWKNREIGFLSVYSKITIEVCTAELDFTPFYSTFFLVKNGKSDYFNQLEHKFRARNCNNYCT